MRQMERQEKPKELDFRNKLNLKTVDIEAHNESKKYIKRGVNEKKVLLVIFARVTKHKLVVSLWFLFRTY